MSLVQRSTQTIMFDCTCYIARILTICMLQSKANKMNEIIINKICRSQRKCINLCRIDAYLDFV